MWQMCDLLCDFILSLCDSRCLILTIITQQTKLGLPDRHHVRPLMVTVMSFFTPPCHCIPIALSGLWLAVWSVLLRLVFPAIFCSLGRSSFVIVLSFSLSVSPISPEEMVFCARQQGLNAFYTLVNELTLSLSDKCQYRFCDSARWRWAAMTRA